MSEDKDGDGWFAYDSRGTDDIPDTPIEWVQLRVIEHAGPFWSQDECLSEDFDELHSEIGVSRGLYDDVMKWHAASPAAGAGHIEQGRALTGRLARELDIEVRSLRE